MYTYFIFSWEEVPVQQWGRGHQFGAEEARARSHPKLCTSIRQLQRDSEYTAGMFADITSGINVYRNQNRFDKKQAENSERLTIARAYNQEEPDQYFLQMKKYTKLFGY